MADKITLEDVSKMKVADLKKVLKEKGLSSTGSKSELVERLTESFTTDNLVAADTDINDAVLEDTPPEVEKTIPESATKPVIQAVKSPEKTPVKPEPKKPTSDDEKADDGTPAAKVSLSTCLTDSEKIAKRAERFGLVNADAKKQARAERFGIEASKTSSPATGADLDALKKRAERFGAVTSTTLSKVDEAEKLKKRKERFGDVTATANNTSNKRAAGGDATVAKPSKFSKITFDSSPSTPAEDDKKKQRAARFGLTS